MTSPTVLAPTPRSTAPKSWWVVLVFSALIAMYALSFFWRGRYAFPPELSESFSARPWGIYPHAFFGAVALLLGPLQFRRSLLLKRRALHRNLGKVYVIAAGMTGIVGFYMSAYAYGGRTPQLGFAVLGVLTATTTFIAYQRIRALDVKSHREWMIRSFALIFAAVTLRIELPLLTIGFHAFEPAYAIVAWLAWVPNLLWAEWYVGRSRLKSHAALPVHSRLQTAGAS